MSPTAQPKTAAGVLGAFTPPDFLDTGTPNCLGVDPDLFFPDPGQSGNSNVVRTARRICRHCDLVDACAEWAISQTWGLSGIWGGTTAKQRARIRHRQETTNAAA